MRNLICSCLFVVAVTVASCGSIDDINAQDSNGNIYGSCMDAGKDNLDAIPCDSSGTKLVCGLIDPKNPGPPQNPNFITRDVNCWVLSVDMVTKLDCVESCN